MLIHPCSSKQLMTGSDICWPQLHPMHVLALEKPNGWKMLKTAQNLDAWCWGPWWVQSPRPWQVDGWKAGHWKVTGRLHWVATWTDLLCGPDPSKLWDNTSAIFCKPKQVDGCRIFESRNALGDVSILHFPWVAPCWIWWGSAKAHGRVPDVASVDLGACQFEELQTATGSIYPGKEKQDTAKNSSMGWFSNTLW